MFQTLTKLCLIMLMLNGLADASCPAQFTTASTLYLPFPTNPATGLPANLNVTVDDAKNTTTLTFTYTDSNLENNTELLSILNKNGNLTSAENDTLQSIINTIKNEIITSFVNNPYVLAHVSAAVLQTLNVEVYFSITSGKRRRRWVAIAIIVIIILLATAPALGKDNPPPPTNGSG